MADKVSKQSTNGVSEKKKQLKSLFPEVFKEGKVDFKKLRKVLGNEVSSENETYSFTWAGKQEAIKNIQASSNGTLVPDKEESIDFDDSENLFIEGDNLEVLKLLQKGYSNSVKMIYIDPTYNRDGDVVYDDDYKEGIESYLRKIGKIDDEGNKLNTNTEANGRYHSDWLSMMYPRLFLARNLLKEDGVIFISIDDNEAYNLRLILNEIFGEENFVASFPRVTKKAGKSSEQVAKNHDLVLCYRKSDALVLNAFEHTDENFKYSDEYEDTRGKYKLNQTLDYGSIQYSPSLDYEIEIEGKIFRPGNVSFEEMQERKSRNPDRDYCWRWSKDLFEFGLKKGFIVVKESTNRIYTKTYENAKIDKDDGEYYVKIEKRTKPVTTLDFVENEFSNDNSKKDFLKLFDKNVFEYTKPVELLKTLVFLGTDEDDIILDFFAGSATTAQAVLDMNEEDGGKRQFICVQLPEPTDEGSTAFQAGYNSIADIAKERIKRVINGVGDNEPIDSGFKLFKLDKSNYKVWEELEADEVTVGDIEEQLELFEDSLVDGYRELDVIYEVIIKEGYSLNATIQELDLEEVTIYKIEDDNGCFYITLDKDVSEDIVEQLDYDEETLFVCLDTALSDDSKINLSLGLNLKTI